jgi:hypothetical protein
MGLLYGLTPPTSIPDRPLPALERIVREAPESLNTFRMDIGLSVFDLAPAVLLFSTNPVAGSERTWCRRSFAGAVAQAPRQHGSPQLGLGLEHSMLLNTVLNCTGGFTPRASYILPRHAGAARQRA